MRIALIALSAACGNPPVPPPISGTAPIHANASCALAAPRRSHVALRFEKWLGRIGDRSWVLAEQANEHVLVALDNDGKLAVTPIPGTSRDKLAMSVVDAHLWLDRDPPGPGQHEELFDIDLSTSRPTITPVEPLTAKTLDGSSSFGISATRMLTFSFASSAPGPGFQLWDRARRIPIATVPYTIHGIRDTPIRCVRDHCFAVTRPDAVGRTFAVQEFAPDGTNTIETISTDDKITDYMIIPDGDHTHIIWNGFDRDGLFTRTLDASGHLIDAEIALSSAPAQETQLVPGMPNAVAFADGQGWVVAALGADSRSLAPPRRLQFPTRSSNLAIAQAADGLLAIGFISSVTIDTAPIASTAYAVFVPDAGTPTAPVDVIFGVRRIGWAAFPLVAFGHAAALVLEAGYGEPDGELVMLREPCAR